VAVTDDVRVSGIDHVELTVPDRREAAEWYERVLGLRVLDEYEAWADDPGGPLMVSSDGGGTKLALFAGEPATGLDEYRVAFGVDAAGFRGFLARLDEVPVFDTAGGRVTAGDVVDHGRSASVYFADPYGHALELTTYEYDDVRDLLGTDG
jgi:catechol 2,3-dioxygenase-like lactoylglutathione lyase family enzyme